MKKTIFGKTGLSVSRIAFGGIPIMRLSTPEAVRVVKEALDLGINFIDTATGYADSQVKIGEAISGLPRKGLVLASKSMANDKKTILEHIDNSLKQMKTAYLDIYQLHNVSSQEKFDAVFAKDGAFEGLMLAVKQGKIRFPGFSAHVMSFAVKMLKTDKFFSVQVPYNFIDRQAEAEVLPLAKKLNAGIIAMKPLGGGMLDDANLCFKFLFKDAGIIPDPGIEKPGQMKEIVSIFNKAESLTETELAEIEKIKKETSGNWCHRCDYCQPCEQGIGISTVLLVRSFIKRMNAEKAIAMVNEVVQKVENCTGCGACKKRCPYGLDIPKLLKENRLVWKEYVKKTCGDRP